MVAMATYYVFAIIGMQLFSHKFVRGKIVGTAFFKNDYWKNNFDTFVRARCVWLTVGRGSRVVDGRTAHHNGCPF